MWHAQTKKWRARVRLLPGDKLKSLGYFKTQEEAACVVLRAWDDALAGDAYRKYRVIIHLYDGDGNFKPKLKVYKYFSNVLRAMRPGVFDDLDYMQHEEDDEEEDEDYDYDYELSESDFESGFDSH